MQAVSDRPTVRPFLPGGWEKPGCWAAPSSCRCDGPSSLVTAVSTELLFRLSGLPSSAYQRGAFEAPPGCGLSGLCFFLWPWESPRWCHSTTASATGDGHWRWVRSGAGRSDAGHLTTVLKRTRVSISLEHELRRGTAGPHGHFRSNFGNFEESASSRVAIALCFRTSRVGRFWFLRVLRRTCHLCLHAQSRPGGWG